MTEPLLVVASGQSNMMGHGLGGTFRNNPNVQVWVSGAGFREANLDVPWITASGESVGGYVTGHEGDPAYLTNNLAVAFCHRLQEEKGRPVYLVIEGDGGQSIDMWVGAGTASPLYSHLKTSAGAALLALGKTRADVILWDQGEADRAGAADVYYKKFQKLCAQFNAEDWCDIRVPIIAGGVAPGTVSGSSNAALSYLNHNYDPQTSCASISGLTFEVDGHIDGASLWEFGYNRYYAMYVGSTGKEQGPVRSTAYLEAAELYAPFWRADGTTGMYVPLRAQENSIDFTPKPSAANNYHALSTYTASLLVTTAGYTILQVPVTTADLTLNGFQIQKKGGAGAGNFPYFTVYANISTFQGAVCAAGSIYPSADNVHDIGTLARRWDDVYATNGTIQISDARDKSPPEQIPDAVLDAWQDVDWCQYRRANGTRLHAGIIAQQVIEAFKAHGVDAGDYGILIHSEWPDQFDAEGVLSVPAGDRYGIRYEEALAMEAALMRRTTARLGKA